MFLLSLFIGLGIMIKLVTLGDWAMIRDTSVSILVVLAEFAVIILTSFFFQIQPFWVFPEAQKVNCVNNVEIWYNARVGNIANLSLSAKVMIEQIELYRDEADERIERYCK